MVLRVIANEIPSAQIKCSAITSAFVISSPFHTSVTPIPLSSDSLVATYIPCKRAHLDFSIYFTSRMNISHDSNKGALSSQLLDPALSTRGIHRFEAMDEYKATPDEADLANFGKKQQLDVCHSAPTSCHTHDTVLC